MLSPETESRVAKLLLTVAEGERSIEISRQVLSDNYDFDPYQIFKAIDIEGKNKVDYINIVDFLRNKGIYSNQTEAQLLILFYDQDNDGLLSYCEFINLVQSEKSLRKSSSIRGDKLSFNIDYSLTKLLEKEITFAREVISLLSSLKCRYDFNVHDIFHYLKGWNTITTDSLKQFLQKNSANCLDSDIRSIVKRLDLNRDGRIDICELHAFLGFPTCSRCCPCTNRCGCSCTCCSCCCSCTYHCSSCIHHSIYCPNSPLRKSLRESAQTSPQKDYNRSIMNLSTSYNNNNNNNMTNYSPLRTSNINNNRGSPEIGKISQNLSLRLSPERKFSPDKTRNMTMRNQSPLGNTFNNTSSVNPNMNSSIDEERRQFLSYLSESMVAEDAIEKKKIDLTLEPDFNVEDAFRLFEIDGRGYITKDDLKFGLNLLGIYPSAADIRLIFKRYDLVNEGALNFADFFDMICPFEKDYRVMIEDRPPNPNNYSRNVDVFSIKTRLGLKSLFNLILDYENKFNALKRGYAMLRYKLKDVFREIDTYGFGYFREEEFTEYIKKNGIYNSGKCADLLFIKLDRNRNGKIDYCEIENELTAGY